MCSIFKEEALLARNLVGKGQSKHRKPGLPANAIDAILSE